MTVSNSTYGPMAQAPTGKPLTKSSSILARAEDGRSIDSGSICWLDFLCFPYINSNLYFEHITVKQVNFRHFSWVWGQRSRSLNSKKHSNCLLAMNWKIWRKNRSKNSGSGRTLDPAGMHHIFSGLSFCTAFFLGGWNSCCLLLFNPFLHILIYFSYAKWHDFLDFLTHPVRRTATSSVLNGTKKIRSCSICGSCIALEQDSWERLRTR